MSPPPGPAKPLIRGSFFEEVGRIAKPDYIPIEADVLRARTKTTGIYETRFSMGQLSIQFVVPPPWCAGEPVADPE